MQQKEQGVKTLLCLSLLMLIQNAFMQGYKNAAETPQKDNSSPFQLVFNDDNFFYEFFYSKFWVRKKWTKTSFWENTFGLQKILGLEQKNYETYNNERKEQVFTSNSKFKKNRFRQQVTYSKSQIASHKQQNDRLTFTFQVTFSNSIPS